MEICHPLLAMLKRWGLVRADPDYRLRNAEELKKDPTSIL
jgi:hypothetical protein